MCVCVYLCAYVCVALGSWMWRAGQQALEALLVKYLLMYEEANPNVSILLPRLPGGEACVACMQRLLPHKRDLK